MTVEVLPSAPASVARKPGLGRGLLIGLAMLWLALIVLAPIGVILAEALRKGVGAALAGLSQPDVWAAARLTLLTTAVATPLNAVLGFADMMRQRLFGPMPDRYGLYADNIHQAGGHLLLTEQQPQVGTTPLHPAGDITLSAAIELQLQLGMTLP